MIKNLKIAFCLMTVVFSIGSWAVDNSSSSVDEEKKIEAFMKKMFDKPNAKLIANPIVVESNYAVASWIQGQSGGRALLIKKDGQWSILTCSGDGLMQVKTLKLAGLPEPVALELISKLSSKESKLPPETRKKFALFRTDSFSH